MQTSQEIQRIDNLINTGHLHDNNKKELNRLCSQVSGDELQDLVTRYELSYLGNLSRSLDESYTAWATEDLRHYYTLLELNTEKSTKLLRDRADAVLIGIPITDSDHLLTIPSFKNVLQPKQFHQLENLAQVVAHLRVDTHPQHIFLQYLMILLNSYRLQILSCKDTTTPSPEIMELLCKIDHVNHLFASYFFEVITDSDLKDEATRVFIKDCLSKVGALTAEIFPKLNQILRDTLRNPTVSLEKIEVYIENFLELHSFIQKKSLLDLIQLLGFSSIAAYKVQLKAERLKQEFIFSGDWKSFLNNIRIYLQKPDLYPDLIHMIFSELTAQAQNPELKHDEHYAFCVHRVIQCIRQQPLEYETAQGFLSILENHDYSPNSDRYPSLLETANPGMIVAVLEKTDFATAVTYALDKGYLPPSAPLFYDMWVENRDRTLKLVNNLHEHHPILCHEILTLIFSDDVYNKQHQEWLAQNDSSFLKPYQSLFFLKRITIKYTTEPAVSESKEESSAEMTPAPSQAQEIVPLEVIWTHWLNCIESGLIISPYILSYESNRQLLTQLQAFQSHIVATQLNLQQIKTLCIALALYHGSHVQASRGFLLVGPSISYPENIGWAHTLLATLLFRVAYPDGCAEMNFRNVVEFLNLDYFNDLQPLSIDTIQEQIIEDVGAAVASDLEGQLPHTYKFVHIFAQLFFNRQGNTLDSMSIYPGSTLRQLPTRCLGLYDAMDASAQIDLPFWISKSKRDQILTISGTLNLQKSLMTATMSLYWMENEDIVISENLRSLMFAMGGSPQEKRQKIRCHTYFLKQLYNTYCVLNPNSTNQNFLHGAELGQAIRSSLGAILTATKNNLQKHKESIDIFYQRFDFLCAIAISCGFNLYPTVRWVANQLGYDREANKAQRDHFRTLEAHFQNYEMIHPSDYTWIKNEIQRAIDTNQFKSSWWSSSTYHNQLILLSQQLSESERLLQPSPPQTISPLRRNSIHALPRRVIGEGSNLDAGMSATP